MIRRAVGFATMGLLLSAGALRAETALAFMSPKNLKEYRFELNSKPRKNKTVEYVIRRDIKGIDGPGRVGYLSKLGDKNIGTLVKLREEGNTLEFRFSILVDQLESTVFTLWGQGARGEGVTFRFNLKDFAPRKLD
jgi:hypothetical protein